MADTTDLYQSGTLGPMLPAIKAVIGLAVLVSTPVALLLRPQRRWGERVLGFTGIYAVALFTAVVVSAWLWRFLTSEEYDTTLLLFLLYTVAFTAVGLYQNFLIWQRHRRGEYHSVHSFERGDSLGFWYKIPWLDSETTVQRFWEPTLIVGIALLLLPVSQIFAGFIFVQGMALAIAENGMYQIHRNTILDIIDSQITARILGGTVGAMVAREGYDPDYIPAPVKPLFDLKNQDTIKDVASMMLGIEDPKLRQLAQVNRSTNGQPVPPGDATTSSDVRDPAQG